jgi:hypothetical protein
LLGLLRGPLSRPKLGLGGGDVTSGPWHPLRACRLTHEQLDSSHPEEPFCR